MDFEHSARAVDYLGRLQDFMATRILPAEAVYEEQRHASGTRTTSRR